MLNNFMRILITGGAGYVGAVLVPFLIKHNYQVTVYDLFIYGKTVLKKNLGKLPVWRVIKERRATIAQTPRQIKDRPNSSTVWNNLFIAGDWTNTNLPATIEGSIYSGLEAGRLAIHSMKRV